MEETTEQSKPISLDEIAPRGAEIFLDRMKKTYRLRPFNVLDERWLRETFGEKIEKIFTEIQIEPLCRILFHQLEEEDKLDFKQLNVKIINEDGDEVVEKFGGYKALMCAVSGMKEKYDIYMALLQTLGFSRPTIEKLAKQDEKKNPLTPTGSG